MAGQRPILLFVHDAAVLSSLHFALTLHGFAVADGSAAPDRSAAAIVIDQARAREGLDLLAALRHAGMTAPAILLATNPSRALRARAGAAEAILVEKPLLGEELTRALALLQDSQKAA